MVILFIVFFLLCILKFGFQLALKMTSVTVKKISVISHRLEGAVISATKASIDL